MRTILSVSGLSKSFGATAALTDVGFTLAAGERLALLGENGAGKSTLIKIIAGVHRPDAGEMTLDGAAHRPSSPGDALAGGVSVVYQEPSFFPRMSVLENLFVGREPRDRLGQVDWRGMRRRGAELFERLDVPVELLNRRMDALSLAEQQLALIARAVDVDAKVLILDEPTSILTDAEVRRLFHTVRRLSEAGVGILYITHRFEELEHVADRFIVLKDGRLAGDLPASAADHDRILEMMSGRPVNATISRTVPDPGPVMLEASGITVPGVLSDAGLSVRRGEVVGLYGLVGAGRTELALTFFGMMRPSAGSMRVEGRAYAPRNPRDAMTHGIAYLPEDRKTLGIFPGMDTLSNITAVRLPALLGRLGVIRRAQERELAARWVRTLRIKAPALSFPVTGLSGGHQQKVLFARQLATEPKILILDEPTRGIDVATKTDIQQRLVEVARDGMAVLVISSDLPELLAVSDRVYVMREGRMAAELSGDDLTEDGVLRATMGVNR
ncbi:ATP-binding cassette domain-containing protein [Nonomuraea phyllanthi]|uniref:ATP-binding cassette domain-containing protein n=1 Tax=Nonomuraea phyllanthi TaxID=2219224 RepID=A0A5C4VCX3_9ACTN|nr:sugar ABC transporter ATP-binding protein [Nonomuraea phyllanthi]KAB8188417.1 ATP-binding cassette domain-containing protein [Nonomuraea phyllanthi]QFY09844.1 ATP-binding cassette domain-containing protein [Nonomuraea phyllanthi]